MNQRIKKELYRNSQYPVPFSFKKWLRKEEISMIATIVFLLIITPIVLTLHFLYYPDRRNILCDIAIALPAILFFSICIFGALQTFFYYRNIRHSDIIITSDEMILPLLRTRGSIKRIGYLKREDIEKIYWREGRNDYLIIKFKKRNDKYPAPLTLRKVLIFEQKQFLEALKKFTDVDIESEISVGDLGYKLRKENGGIIRRFTSQPIYYRIKTKS